MNEINLYDFESLEQSSPTDAQSVEIDYEKIEDAYYNALKRVESEKNLTRDFNPGTDYVEFSSETDAHLYTVGTADAPTTCAQQQLTYLLDIRNVLLIFLLCYFAITIYSKLKTTLINYMR